jgi:hypothetical protein
MTRRPSGSLSGCGIDQLRVARWHRSAQRECEINFMLLTLLALYLVLPLGIAGWHMRRWKRSYKRPVLASVAACGLGLFLAAVAIVSVLSLYAQVGISGAPSAHGSSSWRLSPDEDLALGLVATVVVQCLVLAWMRRVAAGSRTDTGS